MERKKYPSYEEAKRIVVENNVTCCSEYRATCKGLGLPSNPEHTYRDSWTNWFDFLGKYEVSYPTYEEAKRIVVENGIRNTTGYRTKYKGLGLPCDPGRTYRDSWTSWSDFFGNCETTYPTYEEAKRIVIENGINCIIVYKTMYKDFKLPYNPDKAYRESWTNWCDFFGKSKASYPTYEEAKRIVVNNGIMGWTEYSSKCKGLGLPIAPHKVYKDSWSNWADFLGKEPKISSKERKTKILTSLSLNPSLISDKAPIQVIYMVASQVDKKLAMEIEELLGKTSFEDRLNWVKEQLKNLKEGESSESTSESSSMDEMSAMESVMEVFEETMGDVSEEVATSINTIMENYWHNAVNRGLIEEYDN